MKRFFYFLPLLTFSLCLTAISVSLNAAVLTAQPWEIQWRCLSCLMTAINGKGISLSTIPTIFCTWRMMRLWTRTDSSSCPQISPHRTLTMCI